MPKNEKVDYSELKEKTIDLGNASETISEPNKDPIFSTTKPSADKNSGFRKKTYDKKKHITSNEVTNSIYKAASNAASALLNTQNLDPHSLDHNNMIDPLKAAKAAAKAERKQVKKAEKERRKLEKKKRKILEKQQQQMKEVC